MENNIFEYPDDRFCPAYNKVIGDGLCYDSMMCLTGGFKISSTKELAEIKDLKRAKKLCASCKHSDLS